MRLAMREWSESLAGLSGEEIRRGIEQSKQIYAWPPSIAEFVSQCRGGAIEQMGQAYRVRKALPRPNADAELVRENICLMRSALGVKA